MSNKLKVSKCCKKCEAKGISGVIGTPWCGKFGKCSCHTPRSKTRPANYRHGMDGTRFYKVWSHMKERCLNKNYMHFNRYGGRGITICAEWMDFMNFKNDMYEAYLEHAKEYTEKDTTLDRINNDGNYCKENCRWATKKVQQRDLSVRMRNLHVKIPDLSRRANEARKRKLSPERIREIAKIARDKKVEIGKLRKLQDEK